MWSHQWRKSLSSCLGCLGTLGLSLTPYEHAWAAGVTGEMLLKGMKGFQSSFWLRTYGKPLFHLWNGSHDSHPPSLWYVLSWGQIRKLELWSRSSAWQDKEVECEAAVFMFPGSAASSVAVIHPVAIYLSIPFILWESYAFLKKGGRRHFQDGQAQDGRTSLPLIIDCLHGPETPEQDRGGGYLWPV